MRSIDKQLLRFSAHGSGLKISMKAGRLRCRQRRVTLEPLNPEPGTFYYKKGGAISGPPF